MSENDRETWNQKAYAWLTEEQLSIAKSLGVQPGAYLKALDEWQQTVRARKSKGISAPGEPLTDMEKRIAKLVGLTEEEYLFGKQDSDAAGKSVFMHSRSRRIGKDWE